MDDNALLRYSRHILLPEIGIEGQERLLASHALVIGAGGLGSPVSLYLASAGVGRITLCDGDEVDLTNLQRQIVHRTESIGRMKADSARDTLAAINPLVEVITVPERVAESRIGELAATADVVLDAAVRFDGQVAVFDMRREEAPCYACLFPEQGENEDMPCSIMGVFAPVTGIIGTIQAAEALKLLAGIGESLNGRLLLVDALTMELRTIRFNKDRACCVCSEREGKEITEGNKTADGGAVPAA
jgi:molybdopterin/thiamine biosynthesis adenylyltransferase